MRSLGERSLPKPGGALPSHLREGGRVTVHPRRHEVTTDTGDGPTAFWHSRRGIVRATRTEVRQPSLGILRLL